MGLKGILSTGFNAAKLKIQLMQLNSDLVKLENRKAELLTNLGADAWKNKVNNEKYGNIFIKLEILDKNHTRLLGEKSFLQNNIEIEKGNLSKVKGEYSDQIKKVEEKSQILSDSLRKIQIDYQNGLNDLSNTQMEIKHYVEEIENKRIQLTQEVANDAPEDDKRKEELIKDVKILEDKNEVTSKKIPSLQAFVDQKKQEQQPFFMEIGKLEEIIIKLKQEMEVALAPINTNISGYTENIQNTEKEITSLKSQYQALFTELGPIVNTVRPQSTALNSIYTQIDSIIHNLKTKANEIDLSKTQLNSIDPSIMKRFYLLLGFAALLVIGGFFLISSLKNNVTNGGSSTSYGAYYKQLFWNIKIPQSNQYPFEAISSDPRILNNQPTVYLNYTVSDISEIVLMDNVKNSRVPIDISYGNNGTLEITPQSRIKNGNYCLVIGDKFKTLKNLNHWCFFVGN